MPVRSNTVFRVARITFALLSIVLSSLVVASSLQASCGDYVFVRNAEGKLVRASTLMNGHGGCTGPNCHREELPAEATNAEPSIPAESIPVKPPCNGPNCSGRSELPFSSTPLPSPTQSAQKSTALLVKLSDGDVDAGARFAAVPSANAHELHYPQSIFHPPR